MNQKEKKYDAKPPSYSGDGVAVWVNMDKNNVPYLSIKITGHNTIYAWTYDPKEEPKKKDKK